MEQLSFLSADFRTPIERALKVDADGMTTAKALYEFLELRTKDYSRWVKTNITENEFATENEDYWVFRINEENPNGGRPTVDFKLSAHFAKKLSMKGSGKKAEEAREYFTHVEEKVKEASTNISGLSPELQVCYQLLNTMAKQELEQKRQREAIEGINNRFNGFKEAINPVRENWRRTMNEKLTEIQKASGIDFSFLRSEIYREVESRAGVNLSIRLENKKKRFKTEGYTKTSVDRLNNMDIIEEDKKLKEIMSAIVAEYTIKYCC